MAVVGPFAQKVGHVGCNINIIQDKSKDVVLFVLLRLVLREGSVLSGGKDVLG